MGKRVLGLIAIFALAAGACIDDVRAMPRAPRGLAIEAEAGAGWREGLAGDTVDVPVRVSGIWEGAVVLSVGWASRATASSVFRLPPFNGGDSVRCLLRIVVPFAEGDEESLAVEAREDSAGGPLIARAAVPIGPTTAGEISPISLDAEGLSVLGVWPPHLLLAGGGALRLYDLGAGEEAGPGIAGAEDASLGNGFVLYEREGGIHRCELDWEGSRPVSDPSFPSFRPAAGDSCSAWFRSCCGTFGELLVLADRGGAHVIPFSLPPSGRPAVRGDRVAWLESDGETWVIRAADLSKSECAEICASADSLLPPSVGPEGIAFAARCGSRWVLLLHRFADGTTDTIASGSSLRDPVLGGGLLLWREGEDGEWSVRGRRLEDGRSFPVSSPAGRGGTFAFRDSVVVWAEDRPEGRRLRALRIRLPKAPAPEIRVRFGCARAVGDRVVIEWTVEGEVGAAPYVVHRFEGEGNGEGVDVAGGTLGGPGYYFSEDRSLPAEGERQRVRYFLTLEVPGGPLRFGPVAVLLPDRFRVLSLVAEGPNPAAGPVHFSLEVPLGAGRAEVAFSVYDCRGRRVREIEAGLARPGRVPLVWDRKNDEGREVAAGVYFLRFRVGETYRATKKVVLLPRG
ncbi:MAG: FlgD immunoglobulin-like domain containing protein [Candidatus Eisenbacteria bacterium]